MIKKQPGGAGPPASSNSRPCGASPGLARRKLQHQGAPIIRGNQMNPGGASRPEIARRLGGRFFSAPVPSGCALDRRAIQAHVFDVDEVKICSSCNRAKTRSKTPALLQRFTPRVNSMPIAQMLGQTSPFATMLNHIQQGIDQLQIGHAHIATLARQTTSDALELTLSEFHARRECQLLPNCQLVLLTGS